MENILLIVQITFYIILSFTITFYVYKTWKREKEFDKLKKDILKDTENSTKLFLEKLKEMSMIAENNKIDGGNDPFKV